MEKVKRSNQIVRILPPATTFRPMDGRRYTFTHSKKTGEVCVSIGYHFDYSIIDPKSRDEILAAWTYQTGQYILAVTVLVNDGSFDEKTAKRRYDEFRENLATAIGTMINGDRRFFEYFPWLLDAPIYVHFEWKRSNNKPPGYYGKPRQYLEKNHTTSLQK